MTASPPLTPLHSASEPANPSDPARLDSILDALGVGDDNNDDDSEDFDGDSGGDYSCEGEGDDEVDAYAVLNVSKDATPAEIRARFHRLSLLMHPDRGVLSSTSFPVVSDAHEKLRDQRSRNAYNALGDEGVRLLANTLHANLLTPEALQEELMQRAVDQEIARLHSLSLMRCRGELTVDSKGGVQRGVYSTQLQMNVLSSAVTLGGTMLEVFRPDGRRATRSILSLNWYKAVSAVMSVSASTSTTPGIDVDVWRQMSQRNKAGIGVSLSPEGIGMWLSARRNFSTFHSGTLTWTLGPVPSVEVSHEFGRNTDTGAASKRRLTVSSSLKLGSQTAGVHTKASYRITRSTSMFVDVHLSLAEVSGELGMEKKLGTRATIGYGVNCDYISGSSFFVLIRNNSCRLRVPVFVREWRVLLMGALLPLVALAVTSAWQRRRFAQFKLSDDGRRYLEARRSAYRLQQVKTVASPCFCVINVVLLLLLLRVKELSARARHSRQLEQSCGGLVIVDAKYGLGKAAEDAAAASEAYCNEILEHWIEEEVDAVVPLQALVHRSRLHLQRGKRAAIPGLYQCQASADSRLFIRYRFGQQLHEVTVFDDEDVQLPNPRHIVDAHPSSRLHSC